MTFEKLQCVLLEMPIGKYITVHINGLYYDKVCDFARDLMILVTNVDNNCIFPIKNVQEDAYVHFCPLFEDVLTTIDAMISQEKHMSHSIISINVFYYTEDHKSIRDKKEYHFVERSEA